MRHVVFSATHDIVETAVHALNVVLYQPQLD